MYVQMTRSDFLSLVEVAEMTGTMTDPPPPPLWTVIPELSQLK